MTLTLEVKNLCHRFEGLSLFKDLAFQIPGGSCTGIVGGNGCGKTTLLNILSGQMNSHSGEILFFPNGPAPDSIQRWPSWRRARHGILHYFQSPRVYKNLTVKEHLILSLAGSRYHRTSFHSLGWHFNRMNRQRIEKRCRELLHSVDLANQVDSLPLQLSYGQQKLLCLAQLMAQKNKRLLLLDEPFAGLNRSFIDRFMQYLIQFKQQGIALLIVEHDLSLLKPLSENLYCLQDGKLDRA